MLNTRPTSTDRLFDRRQRSLHEYLDLARVDLSIAPSSQELEPPAETEAVHIPAYTLSRDPPPQSPRLNRDTSDPKRGPLAAAINALSLRQKPLNLWFRAGDGAGCLLRYLRGAAFAQRAWCAQASSI
ncbi:hypothetical protein DF3PA_70080 [Candidatus Defluviicoccus seviourii]|uniref:Uncharacterized protein n=1 Tax=Candidatus Defluviicoccus seviourii TaxID=2565273 RepID=A0A564WI53_9PROT|nr:hypothetical protein DF3PA_70080 [Candidatus Defluviicoccus seviourii]